MKNKYLICAASLLAFIVIAIAMGQIDGHFQLKMATGSVGDKGRMAIDNYFSAKEKQDTELYGIGASVIEEAPVNEEEITSEEIPQWEDIRQSIYEYQQIEGGRIENLLNLYPVIRHSYERKVLEINSNIEVNRIFGGDENNLVPHSIDGQRIFWADFILSTAYSASGLTYDSVDPEVLVAIRNYVGISSGDEIEYLLKQFLETAGGKIGLTFSVSEVINILSSRYSSFSFDELYELSLGNPLLAVQEATASALQYVAVFNDDEIFRWSQWLERVSVMEGLNDSGRKKVVDRLIESAILSCGASIYPTLMNLFKESILKESILNVEPPQFPRRYLFHRNCLSTIKKLIFSDFWGNDYVEQEVVNILSDASLTDFHLTIVSELSRSDSLSLEDIDRLGVRGIVQRFAMDERHVNDSRDLYMILGFYERFGRASDEQYIFPFKQRFPDFENKINSVIEEIRSRP
ncbi:MAG: hypothetical protein NUW37_08490 [Planctomycetes bacterium]|nr:hypothetical protein [Planctomycetota bacterium]